MRPLSILVTTHNEAPNIERCLRSVAWADDILVVDSFSTDDTVALAQQCGARVEQRAYAGPADQKNWAIPRARHEWVLILDADEEVSPGLAAEIRALLAQDDIPQDAFWIGRDNHFLGRRVRYSGWQNDAVVRLIFRDRARYDARQVHEEIDTSQLRVGRLRGKLEHYTFRSLDHFLDKTRRYARWSARDHAPRTGRIGLFHLLVKPVFRFFKHYILKGGFRDGRVGLIVSAVMAWGVFLRYVYLWEDRRGRSRES
jgi:glycosyltransferase involved in cell wall biosynthesis